MTSRGFDVIIGNPPYVRLSRVRDYRPRGYVTLDAGDLYPLVMERAFSLCDESARLAWIVPVSSLAGEKFGSVQRLLLRHHVLSSSYDDRPSKLFSDLEHIRLAVHLIKAKPQRPAMYTTRYHRWRSEERPLLFSRLAYVPSAPQLVTNTIPKMGDGRDVAILSKLASFKSQLSSSIVSVSKHRIYYTRKLSSYVQVLDFVPHIEGLSGDIQPPSELKSIFFPSTREAYVALAALNSSLFYWFLRVFSDCRNLNQREILCFPLDVGRIAGSSSGETLERLSLALMADIQAKSEVKKMGKLFIQNTFPVRSRSIIDEIDWTLGVELGFSEDEVDWIVGFDDKYRRRP